jgi:hypothetical protein
MIIAHCMLISSVFAQQNIEQGYIITIQEDTIYGEIINNTYSTNATQCKFRPSDSKSFTIYYPGDIYGYRFTAGKYYVSKSITSDSVVKKLFLEFLIDGELDIYFYQDKGKINHYYASRDSLRLLELEYSVNIVNIDGEIFEKEIMKYVGVLNALTSDYPEFQNTILTLKEPSHKKLIKFSEDYHNVACPNAECIIYQKKIKYKFDIELVGGVKINSYDRKEYAKPNNPFMGIKLYINNPRFSEKSYFGIGYIQEGKLINDKSNTSFKNFSIPITYGYYPTQKRVSYFFSGGVCIRSHDKKIFSSIIITPGIKYDFENLYLKLYAEMEFIGKIIIPVGYYSTNIGLGIVYKLNY